MQFRLQSLLPNLHLSHSEPLLFLGESDESVSITFRQVQVAHVRALLTLGVEIDEEDDEDDEDSKLERKEITLCTASLTCDPPNDVLTEFGELEPRMGELPDQLMHSLSSAQLFNQMSGTYAERFETPPRLRMGTIFGAYASEIEEKLRSETSRAIHLLIWRTGIRGHHEPSHRQRYECSNDGTAWRTIYGNMVSSWSISIPLSVTPQVESDLGAMFLDSRTEPLGHELMREAWSLRGSSPRSALLTGVAAAEVGFKQFVSSIVPNAAWLVENLPTPPLEKMLRGFLPHLLTVRQSESVLPLPTVKIIKTIKHAVEIRNKIAHSKSLPPDVAEVERILTAIADLLWLLDFYSGSEWALD